MTGSNGGRIADPVPARLSLRELRERAGLTQ